MFHVKKRLNLNCIDISMLLPSFYENQIFQSIDLKKIGLLRKRQCYQLCVSCDMYTFFSKLPKIDSTYFL